MYRWDIYIGGGGRGEHVKIGAVCGRRNYRDVKRMLIGYWFHVVQDGTPVVTGSCECVIDLSASSEGLCSIQLTRKIYIS
jgi:hypothetical protein